MFDYNRNNIFNDPFLTCTHSSIIIYLTIVILSSIPNNFPTDTKDWSQLLPVSGMGVMTRKGFSTPQHQMKFNLIQDTFCLRCLNSLQGIKLTHFRPRLTGQAVSGPPLTLVLGPICVMQLIGSNNSIYRDFHLVLSLAVSTVPKWSIFKTERVYRSLNPGFLRK